MESNLLTIDHTQSVFCFTSDIDWASDYVWERMHLLYKHFDIPPTYFVTHTSPFLEQLKKDNTVTLGIHPNFAPGSSHGKDIEAIIDHCFGIVPGTVYCRTHRYIASNDICYALYNKGIRCDSSMCTRLGAGLKPLLMNSGIVRFPVFLEDGSYSEYKKDWTLESLLPALNTPGIKVFNLHPVNVIFNIPDRVIYGTIRNHFNHTGWQHAGKNDVEAHAYKGEGPLTLIENVLNYVKTNKKQVLSLASLFNHSDAFM